MRPPSDLHRRARVRRRRSSPETLAALAVVAGLGAIALGGVAVVMRSSSSAPTPAIPPDAQSVISLLSKPSTQRVPFAGSAGTAVLAVGSGGRAAIVLKGFAPAPPGSTYNAWIRVPGGRFEQAATFTEAERVVLLSTSVEKGSVVGITSETSRVVGPSTPPALVAARP